MRIPTAFGGLFALVFAFANGRVSRLSPRAVSALLALTGIIAVYVGRPTEAGGHFLV